MFTECRVYTGRVSEPVPLRQAQKERTREAILAAALQLSHDVGLAQLSLRQVTRAAGVVPTAFYRHFDSMEEVGLALVEQSFMTLLRMIRDAQRDPEVFDNIIDAAADVLVEAVKQSKAHFAFVARVQRPHRAFAHRALHAQVAAMGLHDVSRDAEPKSCAARVTIT